MNTLVSNPGSCLSQGYKHIVETSTLCTLEQNLLKREGINTHSRANAAHPTHREIPNTRGSKYSPLREKKPKIVPLSRRGPSSSETCSSQTGVRQTKSERKHQLQQNLRLKDNSPQLSTSFEPGTGRGLLMCLGPRCNRCILGKRAN